MAFLFLSICSYSDTRSLCSLSLLHGSRVASCKLLQDKNKSWSPLVCLLTVSHTYLLAYRSEILPLKAPPACTTVLTVKKKSRSGAIITRGLPHKFHMRLNHWRGHASWKVPEESHEPQEIYCGFHVSQTNKVSSRQLCLLTGSNKLLKSKSKQCYSRTQFRIRADLGISTWALRIYFSTLNASPLTLSMTYVKLKKTTVSMSLTMDLKSAPGDEQTLWNLSQQR